jgi:hypothetical protein
MSAQGAPPSRHPIEGVGAPKCAVGHALRYYQSGTLPDVYVGAGLISCGECGKLWHCAGRSYYHCDECNEFDMCEECAVQGADSQLPAPASAISSAAHPPLPPHKHGKRHTDDRYAAQMDALVDILNVCLPACSRARRRSARFRQTQPVDGGLASQRAGADCRVSYVRDWHVKLCRRRGDETRGLKLRCRCDSVRYYRAFPKPAFILPPSINRALSEHVVRKRGTIIYERWIFHQHCRIRIDRRRRDQRSSAAVVCR